MRGLEGWMLDGSAVRFGLTVAAAAAVASANITETTSAARVVITLVWTTAQLCVPRSEGALINSGGVHDGDEESDDETLQFEHGDVSGVVTGWLMSSKGIHPCFCVVSSFSASTRSPVLGLLYLRSDPSSSQSFQSGSFIVPFVAALSPRFRSLQLLPSLPQARIRQFPRLTVPATRQSGWNPWYPFIRVRR